MRCPTLQRTTGVAATALEYLGDCCFLRRVGIFHALRCRH